MSRKELRRRNARRASGERKIRYRAWVLSVVARAEKRHSKSKGPLKWCNTCSRTHRSHETCRLYLRTITAKSGDKMKVWAH